jgi:hypothetical protein
MAQEGLNREDIKKRSRPTFPIYTRSLQPVQARTCRHFNDAPLHRISNLRRQRGSWEFRLPWRSSISESDAHETLESRRSISADARDSVRHRLSAIKGMSTSVAAPLDGRPGCPACNRFRPGWYQRRRMGLRTWTLRITAIEGNPPELSRGTQPLDDIVGGVRPLQPDRAETR